MGSVMFDTIKQLYNLIWFCKKVSIPFEVYAFTNEWSYRDYDKDYYVEKIPGFFKVDETFNLMNLFTHKTNGRDLEQQMINMFRIAAHFAAVTGRVISISIPIVCVFLELLLTSLLSHCIRLSLSSKFKTKSRKFSVLFLLMARQML